MENRVAYKKKVYSFYFQRSVHTWLVEAEPSKTCEDCNRNGTNICNCFFQCILRHFNGAVSSDLSDCVSIYMVKKKNRTLGLCSQISAFMGVILEKLVKFLYTSNNILDILDFFKKLPDKRRVVLSRSWLERGLLTRGVGFPLKWGLIIKGKWCFLGNLYRKSTNYTNLDKNFG